MNTAVAVTQVPRNDLFQADTFLDARLRAATLRDEVSAFSELSSILVDAPQRALQRFLELAAALCHAGTAGLSLLVKNEEGPAMLRWEAISGALAGNEGAMLQRDFSLCGLCLDAGSPIVVSQPERVFKYFRAFTPAITEALVIPLYDSKKSPLGTIWLARHDTSHFGTYDAFIIEQLATQLVLALKLVNTQSEYNAALTLIEAYKSKDREAAAELAAESTRRLIAERSERGMLAKLEFKDAALREVDHRAKNTLQVVANLLVLQSRTTSSTEVRDALQEAYRRLHVLANLHQLLHMSDSGSREVQMALLFASLGDALRQSFGERSTDVDLRLAVDEFEYPETLAIPLALLANELVTNAYKHAFPGGLKGAIDVSLKRSTDGIVLQVSDNGVGTRSGVDDKGLGHKLIRNFSAHLSGALVYSAPAEGSGMTATITIRPTDQGVVKPDPMRPREINSWEAAL